MFIVGLTGKADWFFNIDDITVADLRSMANLILFMLLNYNTFVVTILSLVSIFMVPQYFIAVVHVDKFLEDDANRSD